MVHRKLTLEFVCDVLKENGVIAPDTAALVLERQDEQREKLRTLHSLKGDGDGLAITPAEIIASFNITDPACPKKSPITEARVMRLVAAALQVPFRTIDPLELDLDVVTRTVSRAFAIRKLAVPVAIENGQLHVAMVDPLDREVIDDMHTVQKLAVVPVVSTKADIVRLIQQFFGFKQSVVRAERELAAPPADLGNLEQYARVGGTHATESTDKYIQNAVDYLFRYAFEQRASDIHIEPKRERSIVRFRIDGILHTSYSVPVVVHHALVSRLKALSRLNIAEKRRPQDGRIKLSLDEREVEIRVSTVPVAFGEKAVLRLLNPDVLFQDLEKLGFEAGELITYRRFLEQPHGIILFTGPTGSGKTTSLYSTLKFLATPEKNITTIEDPIEMVCEDYNQIAVQPAVGITFASILRTVLRQDPDIIMVGEIRDSETARNAIQAALTGHLVLSTLHTNDAASAVTRLVDLGVEPFLVGSTLIGVVAQRLVRTVCPHCAETLSLSRADFAALGMEVPAQGADTVRMRQGRGCLQCRSTGYLGREAVFEILPVTETIRGLMSRPGAGGAIQKQGRRDGMRLLRENAVAKVLKGRTTLQEALRCISQGT